MHGSDLYLYTTVVLTVLSAVVIPDVSEAFQTSGHAVCVYSVCGGP